MRDSVVFFFPWREVSGGPYYLSGLANALSESPEVRVYYVDYAPGLSDGLLCGRVRKIVYTEPFDFPLREAVTLITPIYCASHIPRLHPDSRILFVNWHNYCIQALVDVWRLGGAELQRFLRLVYETDSVFFADRAHRLAQNDWVEGGAFSFPERYVPIVIPPKAERARRTPVRPGEMNIAVLGRLSPDKAYAAVNLLKRLDALARDAGESVYNVYIIGDGPREELIRTLPLSGGIRLHMLGTVSGEALDAFLSRRTDVLFAMGRSVLEGGALGLPCVILPHSDRPFSADVFTYLHESRGYALGWYDDQAGRLGVPVHPLGEILADIRAPGRKGELGRSALAHCRTYHASNLGQLRQALEATSLTARAFAGFSRRQGRLRVGGIPVGRLTTTFDEGEKRIDLMGIRSFVRFRRTEDGEELLILGRKQRVFTAAKEEGALRLRFLGKTIPFLKL